MNQEEAIDDLLRDAGMSLVKPVRTPIVHYSDEVFLDNENLLLLHGNDGQPKVKTFQSVVGSLLRV